MAPQFSMLSPSLSTGGDGSGRLRLCGTNLPLPKHRPAPPWIRDNDPPAFPSLAPHAEGATPLSAAITGSNKLALSPLKLYSPSSLKMLMDWNSKAPPSLWDWDPQPEWPADVASSSKNTIPIDSSLLPLNLAAAAAAAAAQEPPIGLKLGKRTYFEDVCGVVAPAAAKSISTSSAAAAEAAAIKRTRASSLQTFRCQVEGCHFDLTGAKDYHRKHRVCEIHSKSPRVVVAGQERRFCQQCSRFHDLGAFDEMKKSCRKRLLDHNARRRKPQPGTISFGSTARLPLPFYDNRQQMNLLASRDPFGQIRPSVGSTWEGSVDFKLADMKGPWMKSTKGDSEGQLLHSGSELSNAYSTLRHDLDKIFPFKAPTAEILNQGPDASAVVSSLNREPDLRRASSLLSTNSWVSAEPVPTTSMALPVHTNQSRAAQHTIQTVNSAFDYWQHEQPSQVPHFHMHNSGSQFQEFQLLKSPFGMTFFDSSEIQ